jgi:hypothetical protein
MTTGKFAQAAEILQHSSTRFFPDYAGKKRFGKPRLEAVNLVNFELVRGELFVPGAFAVASAAKTASMSSQECR